MPTVPYSPVRDVAPSTASPSNYQSIAAQPADFGAQVGAADVGLAAKIEGAGDAAEHAAVAIQTLHNNVAVDAGFNTHQTEVNNALYGDPNKPGDPGYFGLHGEAAERARPDVLKRLEDSRKNIAASLDNGTQQLGFNEASRRLNMFATEQVGRHYETEYNRWATETQSARIDITARDASNNYNSEEAFQHNLADAQHAADAKSALAGADPNSDAGKAIFADNRLQAAQVIYRARAVGMGNNDPVAAEEFLKKNQDKFDAITFHTLSGEFRVKAEEAAVAAGINRVIGAPGTLRPSGAMGAGSNTGPVANKSLPPEAQRFLPALSMGEGHYGSPAPLGDRSQTPISNNRYQFLYNTWAGAAPAAGVNPGDRSPEAQDAVAWSHAQDIYRRNTGSELQADIAAGGNVAKIAGALNKTWPSLPGGKEQQETLPQFAAQLGQPLAGPRAGTVPQAPGLVPASATTGQAAAPQPAAASPDHNPQAFTAEQQMIEKAWTEARASFPDNPRLQHQLVQGIYQHISETNTLQAKYEAEQAKAKRDAQEAAGQTVLKQLMTDPSKFDPATIRDNPDLSYTQKEALWNLSRTHLAKTTDDHDIKTYGSGFFDAYQKIHLPPNSPERISDPAQLYSHVGANGDLTVAGVEKLTQEIQGKRTPEGEAEATMRRQFLMNARAQITGTSEQLHLRDPKGDELYLKFLAKALPDIEARKSGGLTYDQIYNPDNKAAYAGVTIGQFKRPMSQWVQDMVNANSEAGAAAPPGTPTPAAPVGTPTAGPSLAELEAEMRRRGMLAAPKPAPPQAPH